MKLGANSSLKTGRVHDQTLSADCGDPQRSRCTEQGRASRDSLPANRHGRTATAKRGGPATAVTGRVSGTQEMHSRPPLVCEKLVLETQAADDMPGLN